MITAVSCALQAAEAKQRRLEALSRDTARLEEVRQEFFEELEQLDGWILAASARLREAEPTDTATELEAKLGESRRFQEELNEQIQQLSDLGVRFDQICEFQEAALARPLKERLQDLRQILDALKQAALEHQGQLREAMKAASRAEGGGEVQEEEQAWAARAKLQREPSSGALERGQKQKEAEEAVTEVSAWRWLGPLF